MEKSLFATELESRMLTYEQMHEEIINNVSDLKRILESTILHEAILRDVFGRVEGIISRAVLIGDAAANLQHLAKTRGGELDAGEGTQGGTVVSAHTDRVGSFLSFTVSQRSASSFSGREFGV